MFWAGASDFGLVGLAGSPRVWVHTHKHKLSHCHSSSLVAAAISAYARRSISIVAVLLRQWAHFIVLQRYQDFLVVAASSSSKICCFNSVEAATSSWPSCLAFESSLKVLCWHYRYALFSLVHVWQWHAIFGKSIFDGLSLSHILRVNGPSARRLTELTKQDWVCYFTSKAIETNVKVAGNSLRHFPTAFLCRTATLHRRCE